jgi:hypothetical protein
MEKKTMLTKMLAPVVMGIAFIGTASTVNADDLDGILAVITPAGGGDSVFIEIPTDCDQCKDNVDDMKELVQQLQEHCADLEGELEDMRDDCKGLINGSTPGATWRDKCDNVSGGIYSALLTERQDCRDESADLVNVRNKVQHYCYGAPLYCGNIAGWPN